MMKRKKKILQIEVKHGSNQTLQRSSKIDDRRDYFSIYVHIIDHLKYIRRSTFWGQAIKTYRVHLNVEIVLGKINEEKDKELSSKSL